LSPLSMLQRSIRCCAPSLQQRSSFSFVRRKSTKSSDADVMRRLVAARHAAQGFLPTPVDEAVLQDVLEMTRRSPSSFNSQPWSCVIVQDAAQKERLAAAMLGGNTFKVCCFVTSVHLSVSSIAAMHVQHRAYQMYSSEISHVGILCCALSHQVRGAPLTAIFLADLQPNQRVQRLVEEARAAGVPEGNYHRISQATICNRTLFALQSTSVQSFKQLCSAA
jgi:nitroreductase